MEQKINIKCWYVNWQEKIFPIAWLVDTILLDKNGFFIDSLRWPMKKWITWIRTFLPHFRRTFFPIIWIFFNYLGWIKRKCLGAASRFLLSLWVKLQENICLIKWSNKYFLMVAKHSLVKPYLHGFHTSMWVLAYF
jgi:hypothetical protein